MPDDGAADGDALALAARQLLGPAVEQFVEFENARRFGDLPGNLVLGHTGELEGEAHVLPDRHMRIKRIGLEDHGDATLGWHDVIHLLVAK